MFADDKDLELNAETVEDLDTSGAEAGSVAGGRLAVPGQIQVPKPLGKPIKPIGKPGLPGKGGLMETEGRFCTADSTSACDC